MSTIEKALAKKSSEQKKDNPEVEEKVSSAPIQQEPSSSTSRAHEPSRFLELNKTELNERGYLIDTGARKNIKDEFRQIKRKILNNAFGTASKRLDNSNMVMVSSAKPNEGKTFVTINLALSIALEQDKTVLLIDSDVLRPSVQRELGLKESPGLIEYLLGEIDDPSEIIYSTNIDKLKIIPAGKPHHLSNELLASDRMNELGDELSNRYPDRLVLFDCPPLLGVTETMVLTNLMGQAMIVVEESKTTMNNLITATENFNEKIALGVIVNKAIKSHQDLYGYYGYGYGYNEKG